MIWCLGWLLIRSGHSASHYRQTAADILKAGSRDPGWGGRVARHDEIAAFADKFGAGFAKVLRGKAAVSYNVPFCVGLIGLLRIVTRYRAG
jgi:thiamine pyrophosphate-dependent acetolactate synthase large subunit-like protein